MTTFERLFVAGPATHTEQSNPYYRFVNDTGWTGRSWPSLAGSDPLPYRERPCARAIEGE